MAVRKKAAFIKIDEFSHVNRNILSQLKGNFPGYRFEVIDLFQTIVSKKIVAFHFLIEHWYDIVLFRKSLRSSFVSTTYLFRKVKEYMRDLSGKESYDFTFQTQSVFDASIDGVPHFVYTDHTHKENLRYPGFDHRHFLGEKWTELEAGIYRNAAMNFTMSSNVSRSIVEDYLSGNEKVRCVYCGSNIGMGTDEDIDECKYSGKNILFVGLDWNRKGGPVLVEAFRKVLKFVPDATLTIVGASPSLDLPGCRVIGKIPVADVLNHFNGASVFCMPTNIEPFGLVYIEAMAMKLPIIGTNIGAIPDFIKDGVNGYMVEPGNPGQLADRLIDLLSNPQKCKRFGEAGHSLFIERYTWEETGRKISNTIKQFLN